MKAKCPQCGMRKMRKMTKAEYANSVQDNAASGMTQEEQEQQKGRICDECGYED